MNIKSLGECAFLLRKQRLIYHQLAPRDRVGLTLERLRELCDVRVD